MTVYRHVAEGILGAPGHAIPLLCRRRSLGGGCSWRGGGPWGY